jgi:hypothetical protein
MVTLKATHQRMDTSRGLAKLCEAATWIVMTAEDSLLKHFRVEFSKITIIGSQQVAIVRSSLWPGGCVLSR